MRQSTADRTLYRLPISAVAFSSASSGLTAGNCAPRLLEGPDYCFRRNVPDQVVLCEGTSTETADGGVKAAAASVVGGENFGGRLVGAAVQVDTNFQVIELRHHSRNNFAYFFGRGDSDRVGERDRMDVLYLQQVNRVDDLVARSTGRRRDCQRPSRYRRRYRGRLRRPSSRSFPVLQSRLPASAAGCSAGKSARSNTGNPACARHCVLIARCAPFSLTTMPIISTSSGGSSSLRTSSESAICGTAFGETKADSVDVLETGADQGLQIVDLEIGRDLAFEALPGIARTFDEFDFVSACKCSPRSHRETRRTKILHKIFLTMRSSYQGCDVAVV